MDGVGMRAGDGSNGSDSVFRSVVSVVLSGAFASVQFDEFIQRLFENRQIL